MNRVGQARVLRNNAGDAERALWQGLRMRQVAGCKFRRQCPVGPYVVDFVCLERMLVVEVDGGQHSARQKEDERRTAWLERNGYTVLRFWNNKVLQQREAVLEVIRRTLIDLAPRKTCDLREAGKANVSEASFDHPHPDLPPKGEGVKKPRSEFTDEESGASVITSLPPRGRTGGGESNKVAEVTSDHPHPVLPPNGEGAEEIASGLTGEDGWKREKHRHGDSISDGDP